MQAHVLPTAMLLNLLGWSLQILILTAGIYMFLRFLRRTHGGGLIRGLVVAALIVAVCLWSLSKLVDLSELEYILKSVAGFVVVIFAILFQPELRRGIAQLGEHPLMGRFLQTRKPDSLGEIAEGVVALAARRHGALIAFERETPLDAYIENGVEIDARARSLLLQSLFHPGNTLHDGAIVIRKDRVAAALCLFPLTENIEISKSTGTRHRAALGLTDETDAVTLAISEETGGITVCRAGKMRRNVPPSQLEGALRKTLEGHQDPDSPSWPVELEGRGERGLRLASELFLVDVPRKLAALALAVVLFFVAHQDISSERQFDLRVTTVGPDRPARPVPGELLVQLPSEDTRLIAPRPGEVLHVSLSGARTALEQLGLEFGGVLQLDPIPRPIAGATRPQTPPPRELAVGEVVWSMEDAIADLDLSLTWTGREPPRLEMALVGKESIALSTDHLDVDVRALDPRLEVHLESAIFEPQSAVIVGPVDALAELGAGEIPFELEPLVLGPREAGSWVDRLALSPILEQYGFELLDPKTIQVTLPIHLSRASFGALELPIALTCSDQERAEEARRYSVRPDQGTARFVVHTVGLLPTAAGSSQDGVSSVELAVRAFLEHNVVVFVDFAHLRPGPSGQVEWRWTRSWRDGVADSIGGILPGAELTLELESASQVLLVEREASESAIDHD